MKRALSLAACVALALVATTAVARAQQQEQPDGKALYLKNCRQCHGTLGVPPKTMKAKFEKLADLSDASFIAKRTDDSLVAVIKRGVNNEKDMKGFSDKLTPAEMLAIAKYVRTLSVKSQ